MAKMLFPNQHTPLHLIYGQCDCCLCNAEKRIEELERENMSLRNQLTALSELLYIWAEFKKVIK